MAHASDNDDVASVESWSSCEGTSAVRNDIHARIMAAGRVADVPHSAPPKRRRDMYAAHLAALLTLPADGSQDPPPPPPLADAETAAAQRSVQTTHAANPRFSIRSIVMQRQSTDANAADAVALTAPADDVVGSGTFAPVGDDRQDGAEDVAVHQEFPSGRAGYIQMLHALVRCPYRLYVLPGYDEAPFRKVLLRPARPRWSDGYFGRGFVFDETFATQVTFAQPIDGPFTGELPVGDIVQRIFMFVEATQSDLLAISAVSRAWRRAAVPLPQWCVVPQLQYPSLALERFAEHCHGHDAAIFDGKTVTDRDGYVETMRMRYRLKVDASRIAQKPSGDDSLLRELGYRTVLRYDRSTTLLQFAMSGCISLLVLMFFGTNYGYDAAREAKPPSNGELALNSFVYSALCACVGTIFLQITYSCMPPGGTAKRHNFKVRGEMPSLVALALACYLAAPLALVSARLASAEDVAVLPRIVFGYGDGQCSNPLREFPRDANVTRPHWISLANISSWRVEPWTRGVSSPLYRPRDYWNETTALCTTPTSAERLQRPNWWGDAFTNETVMTMNGTQRVIIDDTTLYQCNDYVTDSPDFVPNGVVLLYPPESLVQSCPSVTPVALHYNVDRREFANLLKKLWRTNATAEDAASIPRDRDLAVLRVPRVSGWLQTAYADNSTMAAVDSWFDDAAPQISSEHARWQTQRVPLVAPAIGTKLPEEMLKQWQEAWWAVVLTAAAIYLSLMGYALLPRRCFSGKQVAYVAMGLYAAVCNPLMLVAWGWVCSSEEYGEREDLCLISRDDSDALFVYGIILCLCYVCCGKSSNSS